MTVGRSTHHGHQEVLVTDGMHQLLLPDGEVQASGVRRPPLNQTTRRCRSMAPRPHSTSAQTFGIDLLLKSRSAMSFSYGNSQASPARSAFTVTAC